MRVAVCSARIGAASCVDAAPALARAFARRGGDRVQLAVVPLAWSGAELDAALRALDAPRRVVAGPDPGALGRALRTELGASGAPVLLDLTALPAEPDSVTAFLAGLGVDDPDALAGLRAHASGLTAVVPSDALGARLLGVQGVAAQAGFDAGRPRGDVLAADARLAALADRLGLPDAPGAGAAGGVGAVVLALGGRLTTGYREITTACRLDATLAAADLVVAGTDTFTIGDFGGPGIIELAAAASELGVPMLALAREPAIGTRELRRHGVESILRLEVAPDAGPDALTAAAAPAARTWLG